MMKNDIPLQQLCSVSATRRPRILTVPGAFRPDPVTPPLPRHLRCPFPLIIALALALAHHPVARPSSAFYHSIPHSHLMCQVGVGSGV